MNRNTIHHHIVHIVCLTLCATLGLTLPSSFAQSAPQAVDLGLSVKWGDRNLLASSPSDEGRFFSWGETAPKTNNSSPDDALFSSAWYSLTQGLPKECVFYRTNDILAKRLKEITHEDPKSISRILHRDYDAAAVQLGEGWRMPTPEEWMELSNNCTLTEERINGVKCLRVTAKNGNSIILPMAGYNISDYKKEHNYATGINAKREDKNKLARYWSSGMKLRQYSGKTTIGDIMNYFSIKYSTGYAMFPSDMAPWAGLPIRPVYVGNADTNNDKKKEENVVKGERPVVEWPGLSQGTHSKTLAVKVGIRSKSPISAATFYINGQPTRGIKAVTNDGYDMVLNPTVQLAPGNNTLKVEVTNTAGTIIDEKTVAYMPVDTDDDNKKEKIVGNDRAVVEWLGLSEGSHSKTMSVKVGIRSKSPITAATFYINGQPTRGIKAVTNDGYDMVLNPTVQLAPGNNTLKVEVTNAAGITIEEKTVAYMPVDDDDDKKKEDKIVSSEKRTALVVGNSAYADNPLPNPVNDATDMAAKLRSLGFDVMLVTNTTRRQLEEKISEFARRAAGCDVAMFYYAGHGIQYNGANYLIPVDATLRSAKDIEYECTDVNRVLANMEDSGCKMNIIALDACRNNPFERAWFRGSTTRGLSAINAPVGSFISYATSPGSTAADGIARNSPYTSALLNVLDEPGLSIENVFKRVAASVYESTNRQQTPWYSSSLFQGDFIFNNRKK